ncbi:vacuolar protein sorting-associated protein 41 homolog isoform X2 [Quercus suber]|uniref:vacuolar protein sorting-associated protein 41 homolog isoform X2 n=1 Tax=Quercus suber TaxID=58331 RepID=UPI000CE1BEAF|nr:vacuolar protein sorting-associated protein 41 homolog [Quercus suber]POE74339.1 vacuolar protein sorting-associated protein 41 like [Quercus suber]
MAPIPSENGVEGDDEREEEDDDEEEEEEEEEEAGEEEEEEEEEPRLKYQRMGGSIPTLLASDTASCIAVAERMIALGTHGGTVHILDFLGNQVKEFPAHTAAVNDLSFDIEGEYVGSCSDDGSVVINSLFTDEKLKFEYHRPMKAIALDPDYSRKTSRRFVTGGLAGHLYYNTKKWFGYRDQVLHSGEGPIHVVKWRTSLVAWANDAGVKVYDTANDQRITFIERPRGSPRPELLLPHLVWQDDALLVIGWGTSVKIASIRTNQNRATNGTYMHVPMSSANKVDIVASFQTSYFISGVAPFGDSLVVLAYILGEEDGEKEFSSTIPSRQGNAQRPEVRIVSWNNDELSTDALPVHGFEHYKAKDYSLAHAPFSGSSYAGGQWAAGDEPLYYIVSPKDVVIAKPRDAEDHIAWLLQHGWHEKALAAVEAGQGRSELLDEVGSRYLDHLIVERKYAEAASLCPKLLRGSASAWERWVFHFAHLRQLPVLVPYMPTDNPRLRDTAYEVALVALATNSSFHKELLSTVKSWPHVIYSALPVISAIEPQLNTSSMTDALKEALAELYVIDGQYEKAFSIYADLMKPEVFDFIEKHNLQDAIQEKVVQLMTIDCKHAVPLLIQNKDVITPSDVVSQLLNSSNKCDNRYFLHLYLHSLFEVNPHSGKDFHDMQVELYADYDPKMLLPFLRSSQHYTLEKAYETCIRRDLLREQVFILGRMGNSRQALAVIINKLGDIEEAVEFVTMQHDDDLWEELIKQCLNKPEMVGVLLEHTVGNLDPLYIVNMVPNGLEIPRLRDRLVKIITDYRTETSLRHGCNDILKADCVNLLVKYYKEARHGIYLSNEEEEARAKRNDSSASQEIEKSSMRTTEVKSKTRGGGRCCMCFDPFSIQNVSVIAFFCCHAYHMTCLMDSTSNVSGKKGSEATSREPLVEYEYDNGDVEDDEDDDEDTQSSSRRVRCILCTTASS